jgi:uncharacterized protein
MIEKTVELGFLFDFYGKLLSKRQYMVIELFYIYDLSLTEIGEEIDITRQGVYDTLKRSEQKLYKYEEKLGLIKKFKEKENNLKYILNISKDIKDEIKISGNDTILQKIKKIENITNSILENSGEGSD